MKIKGRSFESFMDRPGEGNSEGKVLADKSVNKRLKKSKIFHPEYFFFSEPRV